MPFKNHFLNSSGFESEIRHRVEAQKARQSQNAG